MCFGISRRSNVTIGLQDSMMEDVHTSEFVVESTPDKWVYGVTTLTKC